MDNIKQKVFSNLIWRFAERVGAQLVGFVVSIVLARILLPEDYGTIALITVFTTIMQVFVDSGLGNALIKKKDSDDIDFSTVFYTNIVFCSVLYLILFLCAPIISKFYNEESLVSLIRVLGLTIVISGIKNVQQAYVSKNMIFKKFFFATLAGTVGAGILGVLLAINGFGVWALVVQQLFNLTVDTIVLWLTVKWRPKKIFSFKRLKELFSFGWKLLLSSLINSIYNNIRQLFIGKKYSSESLAYYSKAIQFPEIVVNNVNTSIDSVLLPTLSKEQDNKNIIKQMTKRAIKISTFIMAPIMMGLTFTSNNIIILLLTDKWKSCIPFLTIFSIAYMFWPIHTANLNAIKAIGRSDLFLKLEIIKKIIGIVILLLTSQISVIAIAIGLLIGEFLDQIINSWPNKKLINYGYLEQLKDIAPSIILAIFMGVCIYLINFLNLPLICTLIIQIILGGFIYLGVAKILKFESLEYAVEILKDLIKNKKIRS